MAEEPGKREKPLTIPELKRMKERGEKIVLAPVWDYNTTMMAEEAGAHMVSVGGATGAMMLGGQPHALRAEMEDVLFLTRNMAAAVKRTVSFCAMPYGSFHLSNEQAIGNAIRLVKAGAHSVKMQASGPLLERVKAVIDAGVQFIGHVGLLPQYIHKLGGYRIVGRTSDEAIALYREVKNLEELGAYAIEMECVPAKVAAEISKRASIPILGIGSGSGTDGQILALVDIWGLQRTVTSKFAKRYVDLWPVCVDALKKFIGEVETNQFPTGKHSFKIPDEAFEKFMDHVEKKG